MHTFISTILVVWFIATLFAELTVLKRFEIEPELYFQFRSSTPTYPSFYVVFIFVVSFLWAVFIVPEFIQEFRNSKKYKDNV